MTPPFLLGPWLLVSVVSVAVALWRVARKRFKLHPLDKLRGPRSERWIQGNRSRIWHPTEGVKFMEDITKEYGGVVRLHGILGARELFVSDALALQSIVNDTSVWQLPSEVLATNSILFGEGLPGTTGEVHRKHRKEITPVFSKSYLQDLVPVFYSVAHKLRDALDLVVQTDPKEVDLLPWTARVSLELVGQAGLGHSFDEFTDDRPDEYASAVKNLIPQLFRNPIAKAMAPSLQELMSIVRVMDTSSKKLLSSRKASLFNDPADQTTWGKDLMTVLLRNSMHGNTLPDSEILGHINALIFGAVDTTASAFSRMFHVLAQNPDMQDRIRDEYHLAREERGDEELEFKALSNLTYTDAFVREVLRLYAPVPALLRCAIKDTILHLKNPIVGQDGQEINQVLVPAGTTVFASILMSNTSPQIWGDDASEFKPERWLSPLPDRVVNSSLPSAYSHIMTFWGGGSSCLGYVQSWNNRSAWFIDQSSFQWALLELKIVILLLLRSFRFSSGDKEILWRSSGLQFPSVAETGTLALPLKVERL